MMRTGRRRSTAVADLCRATVGRSGTGIATGSGSGSAATAGAIAGAVARAVARAGAITGAGVGAGLGVGAGVGLGLGLGVGVVAGVGAGAGAGVRTGDATATDGEGWTSTGTVALGRLWRAPSATTSSGWSITVGAIRSVRCSKVAASGIRDEPPTRNTPPTSSGGMAASASTSMVSAAVRSRCGRAAFSNSSRVRRT